MLLMTATPIPRSLALTLYGDLDVSMLDERPPGRQPVTHGAPPAGRRATRVLEFIDAQLAQGRQAYIVYPVIEESEKRDLKAATTMAKQLTAGPFAQRGASRCCTAGSRPTSATTSCGASATARSTCSSRRR